MQQLCLQVPQFFWLVHLLTDTNHLHSNIYTKTASLSHSLHFNTVVWNLEKTTHTCCFSTGVWGAKVDNVSSEICRHPCEEVLGLLTEIEGLRVATSNLLEDLERVVRHTTTCTCINCMSAFVHCVCLFSDKAKARKEDIFRKNRKKKNKFCFP